jgi:GH25 family lysozyme M1 (1,4-beta-N-acetylmuramidase)
MSGYRVTIRQGWNGAEQLLNSERYENLRLIDAQITKDVTAYDSFQFTISPNHPQFANINMFTTFVKVTRPDKNKTLFEGRVINPNDTMDTSGVIQKQIVCEALEGFLHDSVQPFKEFHNTSPRDFLQALITEHNNQVEDYKKIKLGNVTVTNSTDNVYRYTEDDKDTYTNIQDKLITSLGGEIRIRHEIDGLYLDYEPKIGSQSQQQIILAKNLLSLQRNVDPSTLFTVLKPLGATQEPKNDTDTNTNTNNSKIDVAYPRLTIASVNNGSEYLRNEELINKFGVQIKTNVWDDVTTADQLLSKGKEFIDNQKNLKIQIQVSYVDLSHITPDKFNEFNCGDTVNVVSSIQGIDLNERITGMTIDLLNVTNSTINIGDDSMTQLTFEAMQSNQLKAENETLRKQLEQKNKVTQSTINQLQQQIDNILKPKPAPAGIGNIIDVSEFQGSIDWATVVANNLSLAIIRVQDGSSHQDLKYMENLQQAISSGARYSVYAYFRGISTSDSQQEAKDFYNRVQKVVSGKRQPIFYAIDVESIEMGGNISDMRAGIESYMSQLNQLGIPDDNIVLYIANQLYDSFDLNVARAGSIWLPSYGKNDGTLEGSLKPSHNYDLWQFTSKGSINGIVGDVDMSTEPSDRFKQRYMS